MIFLSCTLYFSCVGSKLKGEGGWLHGLSENKQKKKSKKVLVGSGMSNFAKKKHPHLVSNVSTAVGNWVYFKSLSRAIVLIYMYVVQLVNTIKVTFIVFFFFN